MTVQCIDAEYKGEERYTKISVAYSNNEQLAQINAALETVLKECTLDYNSYSSNIADGRKVIVTEFHDDNDREGGVILEKLMKILDIKKCQN
ncbi:MAG: hypothetical protein PF439_05750 [Helicobacteraceae bacterium]|jgi:hypothetical protein|nr:hypothetical protein [Helicobacteraceae bacterium]